MSVPDLQQMVAAMTFTGVRVGGIMVFAPFMGSDSIAAPFKAVLTLLVTALLYPLTGIAGVSADPVGWIKVAAGEAVIGLGLGLVLQFSFEAVQFAGQIFGIQTGFSLVTLLDPQTEADSPALMVFTRLIALLSFLELNVHHWLLRGVAASFSYLPPGGLADMRWFSAGSGCRRRLMAGRAADGGAGARRDRGGRRHSGLCRESGASTSRDAGRNSGEKHPRAGRDGNCGRRLAAVLRTRICRRNRAGRKVAALSALGARATELIRGGRK